MPQVSVTKLCKVMHKRCRVMQKRCKVMQKRCKVMQKRCKACPKRAEAGTKWRKAWQKTGNKKRTVVTARFFITERFSRCVRNSYAPVYGRGAWPRRPCGRGL